MSPHPLAHPWKAARATAVSLALTAAALTAAGSVAPVPGLPGATAEPATTVASTAPAPCLTTASAQRVRASSGLDGVDPNDLTLAQTEQSEARLVARVQQRGLSLQRSSLPRTTIDVYVHVITRKDGSGGVSRSRVKKQIAVLNKAYAGKTSSHSTRTGFSFRLKKIDRTKSSSWYTWAPPTDESAGDDVAPKQALHRGGFDDLNVYVADLQDGVLGYGTFPDDTTLKRDGVVLLNASLPGGSAEGYSRGDTATHEVGHWLGLLHTFENGCAAPGDLVDDTAAQDDGDNIFSCDSSLDTCPSTGKDPVHNFMSYGDDACLSRFTKGQAARMAATWAAYRAPGAQG